MGKKKLNYDEVAENIIRLVGGKENINGLRHCITRVRFRLKDENQADEEALKSTEGVVSVVKGGGEYMVVIGNQVEEVYDTICAKLGMSEGISDKKEETEGKKTNIVMRILNVIMGAVTPALNLICAGGVLKGILAILTMFGLPADSGIYVLLNAMGDAVFLFLPIILGYNMAKNQGGDGFLGLVIGAILCYPSVQGVDINLFGFVTNATYTSSFLPVIIITAVAMPISKFLKKRIPKAVSSFLVPVITLLIVMPLGFLLIGPAANLLGNGVNSGINTLLGVAPVFAGVVFGALYQVMILFGIHSALTSFSFMNVLSGNPDAIMAICCYACFAQIGVVLAMYIRTKDEKLKSIALPAFFSGIFGVTEPAIYGVTLPRIKMFVISCIGAGIAGGFLMATDTLMYSFTGLGIVTILGMTSPEAPNFVIPILAAVIPFAVSFIIAFVIYRDEKAETTGRVNLTDNIDSDVTEDSEPSVTITIEAPIPGNVVPIETVPDETFSTGVLGKGIAVEPWEGKVFAPFNGTCETLFETLHALGLKSESGVEVLIHVGLETVSLNGEPFTAHIKEGEYFTKGQLLLEFDMDKIKAAGCETITPMLVTNEDEVGTVVIKDNRIVIGG